MVTDPDILAAALKQLERSPIRFTIRPESLDTNRSRVVNFHTLLRVINKTDGNSSRRSITEQRHGSDALDDFAGMKSERIPVTLMTGKPSCVMERCYG
jgi:hypothetical protein